MAEELVASLIKGYSPQQLAQIKNENHYAEFYTVATVFSLLSTCAVALRVASRHMKNSVVGVDDALVICAWVHHPLNFLFQPTNGHPLGYSVGPDHLDMHWWDISQVLV